MNLIKVKKVSQKNSGFQNTLDKLKSKDEINFNEITNEVESVRSERYEKNKY